MTSAHRPTFDHAKGKDNKNISSISHKRGLASHTKLKFRTKKRKINTEFEEDDEEVEKTGDGRQLDGVKKSDIAGLVESLQSEADNTGVSNEEVITADEKSIEPVNESTSENESAEGSEEDSDDEEALLLEMEKIKKERDEAKRKAEEEEIVKRAKQSNPLMLIDTESKREISRKKSWRDRKTMAKKVAVSDDQKFLNDTVKSDFHKKFLDKYIR